MVQKQMQLCSLENMMGPPVARHSLTTNQFSKARKRFTGYGGVSESGLRCLLEDLFFIPCFDYIILGPVFC